MALYLFRSAVFNTIRCNFRESSRNLNIITFAKFHNINSKHPRIINIIMQQRSHYWVSGIFGKQSELTLKHMDNVPNEFKMIYRNDNVDVPLKWIYFAVFILSGILVGIVVFKIDIESPKLIADKKSVTVRNEILMSLFAFSLCFMVFHGCMKRIPVRIYKVPEKEKHIFIFNAGIPFTTRRVACKKGEFAPLGPIKFVTSLVGENMYRISNKQSVFLFEEGFKVPADFYILLGQQKDYDDD